MNFLADTLSAEWFSELGREMLILAVYSYFYNITSHFEFPDYWITGFLKTLTSRNVIGNNFSLLRIYLKLKLVIINFVSLTLSGPSMTRRRGNLPILLEC